MSQLARTVATTPSEHTADSATTVETDSEIQDVLDALDDADCRAILDATGEEALSASEISETCDMPLSTTYRKLEILTDADLLEERTRIRRSGKHPSEYARRVEEVVISIGISGEIELRVSQPETRRAVHPSLVSDGR